jgi:hypothetical protein
MTAPPTPQPDEKDWTWAITESCPECGFDPRAVARSQVPELIRSYTAQVLSALARPDAPTRPSEKVWSPLEYGCHVRDVCRIFGGRLQLMLTKDDPQFENWDQDETALAGEYWAQDAKAVAAALESNADTLADAFAQVEGDQWERPGRRSNGSVFTVDTFARYLLHDLAHHVWDVRS